MVDEIGTGISVWRVRAKPKPLLNGRSTREISIGKICKKSGKLSGCCLMTDVNFSRFCCEIAEIIDGKVTRKWRENDAKMTRSGVAPLASLVFNWTGNPLVINFKMCKKSGKFSGYWTITTASFRQIRRKMAEIIQFKVKRFNGGEPRRVTCAHFQSTRNPT